MTPLAENSIASAADRAATALRFDTSAPIDVPDPPPARGRVRQLHFAPRTRIFFQGDQRGTVFQVVAGEVMLYKLLPDGRRQLVELLSAGDVFGFPRLSARHTTAETLTATHCVAYDCCLVECSPVLMQELSARLEAQLCALHEHVMLLGRKSAMERMASFLMRFVTGRGGHNCPGPQGGHDDAQIRLHMTRQEIADYLGLTIETVSRLLGKLKRDGIVSIGRLDEIYIGNVCRLCWITATHLTQGPTGMRSAPSADLPCRRGGPD